LRGVKKGRLARSSREIKGTWRVTSREMLRIVETEKLRTSKKAVRLARRQSYPPGLLYTLLSNTSNPSEPA